MALVPAAGAGGGSGAPLPPPEAIASVPAAPGSRLFFTWGAGTQLNLCELQGTAGAAPCASTVAWSAPTMEQRRIAYDVLPLYRQLRQALQRDNGAPGARLALLRTYAASVRQILMSGGSDAEDGGYTLYEAAVWHMLELFFLEPESAEGFFAELYASWLRAHGFLLAAPGTPSLGERVEELRLSERIEADPGYWPVLQRLLAIGQLEAAGELLLAHPAYAAGGDAGPQRDALDRVYQLLRTVPRLRRPSPASATSTSDLGPSDLEILGIASDDALAFRAARGAWARRARALLADNARGAGLWDATAAVDPAAARGLKGMVAVMLGDERALRDACANWAELLAGLLFWRYTDASPQLHLGQLLGSCVEQMAAAAAAGGGEPSNEAFLAFLRELLSLGSQLEVQGVVRLCTNSEFCGLWFVAHAYDVLRGYPRADALISRPLPHLGCDQSEMYTLHYVETLLGGDGTWQVAAEYLAWCPAHGADAMESLLARLPVSLEDALAALKALALCDRHGLASAARALCARLSARASEAGLPGAALQWALRGGDAGRCAALVAPVVAKLAAQLEQRSGSFEVAPLDLPELEELGPLLDCLPPLAGWDGQSRDSPDAQRFDQGFDWTAAHGAKRRGGGGGSAVVGAAANIAYPELQLLRSFSQLQAALRALQAEHARQAAALSRDEAADADTARRTTRARAAAAPATLAADGKPPAALAAAAALGAGAGGAALRAAYQAARRPVMDLLGLPLAPLPLRLPLLRFVLPLLETGFMPFTHSDVQRLLAVLGSALAAQAAARAEGTPADSGPNSSGSDGAGGKGTEEGAGGGGKAVGEVRLALARALARAHIQEVSSEA